MSGSQSGTDPRVGTTLLDKLRVIRRLGAGGMGAVYEVEHLLTGHRRALKVLHKADAEDFDSVARLIREAGVAGRLEGHHVPETYDAGRLEDGSPYILMELLSGRTLRDRLKADVRLPPAEAVRIAADVCDGLQVAHTAGLVHRDIKPENIFLESPADGPERVRLLDFGLAMYARGFTDQFGVLTRMGAVIGTPHYMSPEQVNVQELDLRTDVYSTGVVLYEMLAGRRLIEEMSPALLLSKIATGDHPDFRASLAHVPEPLIAAVGRAVRTDPAQRFASAAEMAAALRAAVAVQAAEPGAPAREEGVGAPAPRRGRGCVAAAVIGLLAVVAVLATAAVVLGGRLLGSGDPSARAEQSAPPAVVAPVAPVALETPTAVEPAKPPDPSPPEPEPAASAASRPTSAPHPTPSATRPSAGSPPASPPPPPPAPPPAGDTPAPHYDTEIAQLAATNPQQCLERLQSGPRTRFRMEVGLGCAASVRNWAAYRRICRALNQDFPGADSARNCRRNVATLNQHGM